ncbi:MAG TPA: DinB family protein [Dehalococcoidia bacterium]|nr:DinB family protein [Dehalococcoidia bacterium]
MPTEYTNYRTGLISRLRAVTDDLSWAVRGATSDMLTYRPSTNEWTIHEHLAHLRDMEQEVYLPLLRWSTIPDMLDPRDYNRREWYEERYRPDESLASIMDDVGRMRDEELLIFRDMSDVTWTRFRIDTNWGPLTCEWTGELMYRHALDHLQCVMALLQDLHLRALAPTAAATKGSET